MSIPLTLRSPYFLLFDVHFAPPPNFFGRTMRFLRNQLVVFWRKSFESWCYDGIQMGNIPTDHEYIDCAYHSSNIITPRRRFRIVACMDRGNPLLFTITSFLQYYIIAAGILVRPEILVPLPPLFAYFRTRKRKQLFWGKKEWIFWGQRNQNSGHFSYLLECELLFGRNQRISMRGIFQS